MVCKEWVVLLLSFFYFPLPPPQFLYLENLLSLNKSARNTLFQYILPMFKTDVGAFGLRMEPTKWGLWST